MKLNADLFALRDSAIDQSMKKIRKNKRKTKKTKN